MQLLHIVINEKIFTFKYLVIANWDGMWYQASDSKITLNKHTKVYWFDSESLINMGINFLLSYYQYRGWYWKHWKKWINSKIIFITKSYRLRN